MNRDDGGPAFPQSRSHEDWWSEVTGGMTMRDYFAAKAMQGLCCNPDMPGIHDVANIAYAMADAMLKARAS